MDLKRKREDEDVGYGDEQQEYSDTELEEEEDTVDKIGTVYKIVCEDENVKECYVGSTTKTLTVRLDGHRYHCKSGNCRVYKFIAENGGINNWRIEKLEQMHFTTRDELRKREQYWKDKLQAVLNANNCYGHDVQKKKIRMKKYYEETKDLHAIKRNKWNAENKQYRIEYSRKYKQEHKEDVREHNRKYRQGHKEQQTKAYKAWAEKNKTHKAEYQRQYRAKKKLEQSMKK